MSEKQKSDCPGSYEVSGYTTDSGKKVDSYTRSCWKHGGGGITNLNEGENPYSDKIFEKANSSDDTPAPTIHAGDSGDWGEIILEALLSLGSIAGRAYLSNKNDENPIFSAEKFPNTKGGGQFIQSNYQNFPLSKFDPKKTETDIKNSMKNIEGILKQKEVSNNDILAIRGSLKNSVGSICNDIESISYRRSQQPEIPTIESVEIEKTIEQDRKQTLDNTTNVITSINLAQNALKKNFDSVSMDSPEYNKKLYEYVRQSDELKKMSNSVMDLFQEAKSPKKNSMNTVNRIRQDLGFAVSRSQLSPYNGTTGNVAGIGSPTGFAVSIEDEKRKYKTDDPTAQRVFKIIEDIDNKIDNKNEDLNKLNDVKTPVTKTQVLKKLETLKTLIEITNKYYPKAEEIDKYNKKGIPYRKDELIYWFDRVINKFPKTINNTNRLVEKYAYYNADKVKNIKKLKEDMYETEKIFPENLKSKITLFTKVSSRIMYLINRIIDNINYRRNPDLKEIEEIDPKYGKKLKMSEENEAIYDYALTHQYDPNNVNELKKFLMRDDVEGYRSNSYQDINGVWTIGYGDTHGVKSGMTTTKEKAEEKLESNIKLASIPIQNYIKIAEKNTGYSIPLTQNQFDSLVSMSFNAGPGTVNKKIIVPYLSKGDYIGAAKQIPYLTEDSYKGGLPKRRKLEKEYFWKGLEFIINF